MPIKSKELSGAICDHLPRWAKATEALEDPNEKFTQALLAICIQLVVDVKHQGFKTCAGRSHATHGLGCFLFGGANGWLENRESLEDLRYSRGNRVWTWPFSNWKFLYNLPDGHLGVRAGGRQPWLWWMQGLWRPAFLLTCQRIRWKRLCRWLFHTKIQRHKDISSNLGQWLARWIVHDEVWSMGNKIFPWWYSLHSRREVRFFIFFASTYLHNFTVIQPNRMEVGTKGHAGRLLFGNLKLVHVLCKDNRHLAGQIHYSEVPLKLSAKIAKSYLIQLYLFLMLVDGSYYISISTKISESVLTL